MNEKTTTFGLSSETLIELLHIGEDIESDTQSEDAAQSEQLKWLLSENLPVESSLLRSMPNMISNNEEITSFLGGDTIEKMLIDSRTDILHIRRIKTYFKLLSASEKNSCRRNAAIVIYYAAIAHALVYHQDLITNATYESISRHLSLLLENSWLDERIADLLEKAHWICHNNLMELKHQEESP